jgi:hypothetical protein
MELKEAQQLLDQFIELENLQIIDYEQKLAQIREVKQTGLLRKIGSEGEETYPAVVRRKGDPPFDSNGSRVIVLDEVPHFPRKKFPCQ